MSIALSTADRALARLDGATLTLPDPDLFVYAFMKQEAVLSSQIEGTQASLEDIFEYEAAADLVERASDVHEVINYIDAMKWGLSQLESRPVSNSLIKEMHARLLRVGRGAERAPGEFRRNQNWIGPPGSTIHDASFVPPAVPLMEEAMGALERFINEPATLPPLIRCALIHAQFETIHPFWDGNGRLGRMIVTLILCNETILSHPVLYLSLFFKANREEYYARLQATRDKGDVEGWLHFFLRGVTVTSRSALNTAQHIIALRRNLSDTARLVTRSPHALALIETMFRHPYFKVKQIADTLGASYPTANALIAEFEEAALIKETTGGKRDRVYAFKPYLDVLHDSIDDLSGVIGTEDYLVTRMD